MSDEIDKRIVEMEFRNKKFQENAEQTIKTLDKLDDSLRFDGNLGKSLDVLASKFTALGSISQGVLESMATDVYQIGKNLAKSLTTDQIGAGFGEYELKMGSIQTIMASTGESLNVVSEKLEELNKYADKTIYSFGDMQQNVSKFTNVGIDLTPAVGAIKGIANLTALSGGNAQQASHAMYNFSQAMSAGYMSLLDWKSIAQVANIGTVEFRNELIKTALDMGTLVKQGDKYVSTTTDLNGRVSDAFEATKGFENSLKSQWLTAEVLTKVLNEYGDETTELGKKALKAATEVKTFSHLLGSLRESAGSGWAETMEIVFGNYDEAVELWTNLFNRIGGWMEASAKRRNDVLTAWKGFGGRDAMIKALENVLNALEAMTKPMSRALDKLLSYNKGWRYLEDQLGTVDIGPVGNAIYESMVRASKGIEKFTESLIPSEETLESMTGICSGFVSVLGVVFDIAKTAVGFIGKIIRVLSPLLKIVLALAGVIGDAIFQITNAVRGALNLGSAARNVSNFFDNMYESVNTFSDKTVAILHNIPGYITKFLETLKNLKLPDFSTIGRAIVDAFSNAISRFKEKKTLKSFFEGLIEPESVKKAAQSIGETFSGLTATIGGWVDKIKEKILSIGPIGEIIVSVFNMLSGAVSSISNGIVNLLSPLLGLTQKVATKTGDILSQIDLASILDVAKIATFVVAMIRVQKAIKSVSEVVDGAQEVLHNFAGVVKNFGGALKDLGKGVKLAFQAEAFKSIAYSIALVMGAVMLLTTADHEKLQDAITAFLLVCAGLVLVIVAISDVGQSVRIIRRVDPFTRLTTALESMASAIAMFSVFAGVIGLIAMVKNIIVSLGKMDPLELNRGLIAMQACMDQVLRIVIAIGIIGATLSLVEKIPTGRSMKTVATLAASLTLFAIGITALLGPIAIISKMNSSTMLKGLVGLAAILSIIVATIGSLAIISRLAPNIGRTLATLSITLVGFTSILFSMIGAVFALGKMNSETASAGMLRLAEAVGIMITSILGLAVAIKIIGKTGDKLAKISLGFAALAGAAAIISLFAPTIISNAASIKNAIYILVDIVVSALIDATDRIVAGALLLIVKVLDALIIYLPNILIQIETIFNQILDWLIRYTPTFIDKVLKIVGLVINSISEGLGDYVDPNAFIKSVLAIEAVLLMISQMAKLRGQIKKAIPTLAMAIVVIGSIGLIFTAFNKLGLPSTRAEGYAKSISSVLVGLTPMMVSLATAGRALERVKIKTMLGLVGSLSLLVAAIGGIFLALDKLELDPTYLIDYSKGIAAAMTGLTPLIVSMGLMVALLGALHLDAGSIFEAGSAIIGVVTIAMAVLAALMALLGGINEWSGGGFKELLEESIEIFGLMGEAIGVLVGSLIGGIAEGGLITVGKGLGDFATSSQPFFAMVESLGTDFGTKIGALADGIMTLTGAGFVNAISDLFSIFTGNSSLGLLGEDLTEFGSYIRSFFDSMSGVTIEEAQALKYAAEGIAALSDAAPKVGGLAQVFTGTTDMYALGNNIASFGPAIVSFAESIKGLDDSAIDRTTRASQMLSILLSAIPKTGGVVQAWSGDVDYAGFAAALPTLGAGIKGFNDAVTDASGKSTISAESIDVATNAAKMITGVVTNLPATGGLWQRITGEQDMGKFVANLPALASGIVAFDNAIKAGGGIDADTTSKAALVAESAANIFAKLPKTGGWAGTLGGEKDLSGFASKLGPLGDGVRSFYAAVTKDGVKIDAETAKLATYVAESAANIQTQLTKNAGFNQWAEGFPNLETFGNNLKPLGEGIHNFTVAIDGLDDTYVGKAMNALSAIADLQNTLDYETLDYMLTIFSGEDTTKLGLFADNLPVLGEGVMAFSKSVEGINVRNVQAATSAINMLVGLADLRNKLGGLSLQAFNDAINALNLSTFNSNIDDVLNGNKELSDLKDKFIKLGSVFYDAMMEGFSVGYNEEKNQRNRLNLTYATKSTLEYIAGKFEEYFNVETRGDIYDRIYGIGKNIIAGIDAGMKNQTSLGALTTTAEDVMNKVITAMEKEAAIESPSKVTAEDGKYLLLGLAKGMKDNVGVASNSATIVTDEVMETLQNGMSTITKRLQDPDFDMSPTITPVVDMSNVRLSAQEADDLFNSKQLSLNANVGSASLDMARSVKMEVNPNAGDISRAKMLEMMSKIGQKLDDMENRLGGMNMVLDTGELVGAITPSMIRSIDKRKVKLARGVVSVGSR